MKIAAIRTHLLRAALDTPFQSASATFRERAHLIVEVETDAGLTGWGECLGPARANAAVVAAMTPTLLGRDPRETGACWLAAYHALRDPGQGGLVTMALSGIDIALWDILGKATGLSVATLLGGRFRERVTAYATGGFRRQGADHVADVAGEAARFRDEGFRALKIKVGFGLAVDLRLIEAVRTAIGPDLRLMIDANHGYDALDASRLGREAALFGIDWLEEPVLPETPDAYAEVRRAQPSPVAGGETWTGPAAIRLALERRAVDILQPDVCGAGGFTEMRRIADLAQHHGIRLVPHVWGTGVALAASLQMIAALAPAPPGPAPRDPLFEFDRTPMPFRQAILKDPVEHADGVVAIPDGPGLGIEIDRTALGAWSA